MLTALSIVRDKKAAKRDRLKAIEFLAERGWGRQPATLDVNVGLDPPEGLFVGWAPGRRPDHGAT